MLRPLELFDLRFFQPIRKLLQLRLASFNQGGLRHILVKSRLGVLRTGGFLKQLLEDLVRAFTVRIVLQKISVFLSGFFVFPQSDGKVRVFVLSHYFIGVPFGEKVTPQHEISHNRVRHKMRSRDPLKHRPQSLGHPPEELLNRVDGGLGSSEGFRHLIREPLVE